MEDFNSKYTGEQVESLLDQVASGNAGGGSGGITVETDPIFSKSPAASITTDKMASWDNKVDSVRGKQLSTEDFTSALKTKLEGLSNYDDTELSEALSTLRGDFDALVSGDTTTAIKTFNEIIAFLDGISDSEDLDSIIAGIELQIAGKQATITDLETIRSGAAAGATAVQPGSLAKVATSGSYNDLDDKPDADVYIADFTLTDLESAYEYALEYPSTDSIIELDGNGFLQATIDRKLIMIPYTNSDMSGVYGYITVTSVFNDRGNYVSLTIDNFGTKWYLDIPGDSLREGKINLRIPYERNETRVRVIYGVNEEVTISEDSSPETLVKRNSNGGIEVTTIDANFFRDTQGNTWTTPTASSGVQADADYIFQEQLKSGQNIKTVNNQSLLGSGNINIEGGSAVYITDFTVDTLFYAIDNALANPDKYYHLDASSDLIHALTEGKIILIPFRQDPGYISAICAMNDGETTYLTIPRGTTLIKLKIDNEDLYHDVIYLTANKISIEKISYFAEPDTIVKRTDIGGVYATVWHDEAGNTWVTPSSSQASKEGADYVLQEYIPDLDDIRDGASKGATALQEEQYKGTVSTVDTSDAVDEPELPPAIENAVSTNRIIACVARFDGSNWNLINDEGHTPINVIGISGTSTDEFTITFPAYSKVNSLVATPDETLAAGGIKCGASVGLDYATIRLRQDRLVRLFVTTNANGTGGTVTRQEWDTRTDVSGFTVSIIQNTSLGNYIRLDDTKGNIDGSALPTIGGAFNAFLFGTKPGYINIQLRKADGSVSDYKNAEFQIGWPMLNVKPIFTSQEMSKGNIWIYGIMEE